MMSMRISLFFFLFLAPLHLFSNSTDTTLQSLYLYPSVEEAHRIQIQGELGGQAVLILDPNVCGLNQFGDTEICTQMYPPRIDIQMKQLRIADPKELGRSIFQLEGPFLNPENDYFLISAPQEGGIFRLIIENRYEGVRQIVALEKVTQDIADSV